jgi:outer membrane protein OmpA-like peptidoglycan-associated protein
MNFKILPLAAMFLSTATAIAQTSDTSDVTPIRVGVAIGASLNVHGAGFVKLPGTPNCCPEFTSGFGVGPYAALVGYIPLSESFRLGLRAGYLKHDAELTRSEQIAVEGDDGPIATSAEHSIDGSLASLSAEVRGELSVTRRFWLALGTRVGSMIQKEFSQREQLGDAAPGVFENGRRTRNEFSGEIPDASGIAAALLFGAGYDVPLDADGYFLASPEVTFGLALASVNDSVDWMPHALQIGVAFTYDFAKYRKPEPIPEPIPPRLAADVEFAPLSADEKRTREPGTIRVTEIVDIRHSPIIPAVFFDSASARIASRYNLLGSETAAAYSLNGFESEDFVSQHREVLNVIGHRLRGRADATITLVPSVAGDEPLSIAKARVEAVREYLTTAWGIAASRIGVDRDNDPLRKASEKFADGLEENRHVGIRASDPAIVAPVSSQETRMQFEPEMVTVVPSITADAGIDKASVDIKLNGRRLKSFDYGSSEWASNGDIGWRVNADVLNLEELPASVTADIRVADKTGKSVEGTSDSALSLVSGKRVNLGRIETLGRRKRVTYQLVAVPLGSPELDPINRELMRELASQVKPGATITIRGFADRLGNPEYNTRLSQKRADIAVNTLRGLLPKEVLDSVTIDAKGGGVDNSRFTNDLPEGRVLTRGVSVVLEQDE